MRTRCSFSHPLRTREAITSTVPREREIHRAAPGPRQIGYSGCSLDRVSDGFEFGGWPQGHGKDNRPFQSPPRESFTLIVQGGNFP